VLGSFAMYYREVRSPDAHDLGLIDTATDLAGIAIGRMRHERELQRHRAHLEELVAERTAALTQAKEQSEQVNRELAAALENLSITQEELVRRDKLAALGALVAGIAHELNTPIGNGLVVATTMAERTRELQASSSTACAAPSWKPTWPRPARPTPSCCATCSAPPTWWPASSRSPSTAPARSAAISCCASSSPN
jgi:signal transduction histidine kinase